ncbi:hypothetical protein EXIGLDRAFT_745912 [Exidia glandulosa HHB12029]|uniref:Uncharacterized protein n=1 Tax=Exidia glandulosa HHB12029 TaxID=1314781 RepID=A0A165MYI1_EXIGL|nr:hypothetical protein EXIGLDRAFT_745912 [Exidia glandulosa HHB12029]
MRAAAATRTARAARTYAKACDIVSRTRACARCDERHREPDARDDRDRRATVVSERHNAASKRVIARGAREAMNDRTLARNTQRDVLGERQESRTHPEYPRTTLGHLDGMPYRHAAEDAVTREAKVRGGRDVCEGCTHVQGAGRGSMEHSRGVHLREPSMCSKVKRESKQPDPHISDNAVGRRGEDSNRCAPVVEVLRSLLKLGCLRSVAEAW